MSKLETKSCSAGQVQRICCPNCGCSAAERYYLPEYRIVRTQCGSCDYLMVMGEGDTHQQLQLACQIAPHGAIQFSHAVRQCSCHASFQRWQW